MEQKTYTISDLAKEHAVTPRTIRLYEELGIVAPKREGNKRIYVERDRVRLRLAIRGKGLGMSLAEVKELIDMYDNTGRDEKKQLKRLLEKLQERRDILLAQRRDIEITLAEIDRIADKARSTLADLERAKAS
ncbi:MerR family DNA-binding transcriptional regulator [uncultured Thiothrix sp.]|jgi:DNA-binding transcriptional MerR regulator|uniref:MerR family transcriptional regulator n=1 Tax=uncultured Thiothrix sp. TaxID=223185 RepID=UPI00263933FF|nr:MerR family DNA-binding transcriptional regulator [uncultured Thiothrix sp.]HMT93532.1 MerR family DNA-binding transcriptional regulator [Thiolinea sp.]